VVSGYGVNKGKKTKSEASVAGAEPAGGWTAFHQYIQTHSLLPRQSASKDSVEISFRINKAGKPIDLQVVKSVNTAIDKEAKRLLLEGPVWTNYGTRKKRVHVRIAL